AFLRNPRDRAAIDRTIAIPAELAALASELAEVAAEASERGKPVLRGDAAAGALLAEAAARAAANLVAINARADDTPIGDPPLAWARCVAACGAVAPRPRTCPSCRRAPCGLPPTGRPASPDPCAARRSFARRVSDPGATAGAAPAGMPPRASHSSRTWR